jgi:NTE family protein
VTERALVLGGGGVAGIAWETGVLAGLADEGIDVTGADLIIGTSAGASVAAQVTSGVGLDALFERQVAPPAGAEELMAVLDEAAMAELFGSAVASSRSPLELRAALGRKALEVDTIPEARRREVIAGRLPNHDWPAQQIRLVAVDAVTGQERVFGNDSGVELVDAVAASCAVPGVWPPTTIDGRAYIDGGVRTIANADLAEGHDPVLVLAPLEELPGVADPEVLTRVERMQASARVLVIRPDDASLAAIGANPLDPATRQPAAQAGRAQGHAVAPAVKDLWLAQP